MKAKFICKNGLFLFLFFLITFSCTENELRPEKVILDNQSLERVLRAREDYSNFIGLHYQNQQSISSLTSVESLSLQHLVTRTFNLKGRNSKEVDAFLKSIKFYPEAINRMESVLNFLDTRYAYEESDFNELVNKHLNELRDGNSNFNAGGRSMVITCDTYCTRRAEENYPEQPTFRDIYYAGCMDGCKNGPHAL